MSPAVVTLIVVCSVAAYFAVAALIGGRTDLRLRRRCTNPPKWESIAGGDAHYGHEHTEVALLCGLLWPLSWAFFLARRVARR